MHTYPYSACAVSSPEECVRYYKSRDYAGIIVTDHFLNGNTGCPRNLPWEKQIKFFAQGYERAKNEGEKCGLDVFFGLEYSLNGSDLLIYGLTVEYLIKYKKFDSLDLKTLSAAVRAEGGYLAQAHPYRTAFWIPDPYPVSPDFIDGIEVYNASMPDSVNKQAMNFAKKHNLAKQSGSDAHQTHLRRPSGIILKRPAESIFDIITEIKQNQIELIF